MKRAGCAEAQLRGDVVLHQGRGGGGERDDRRGPQRRQVLAEHAVVGPEIVAPLRDAVRLVDGDQRRLALGQHLREAGDAQALRRDEEELQRAVEVVDAGLARGGAVAAGVDALHGEAALLELGHLIFHQGDQRADHQRGAAARDAGQLVAERLAGAGRHHQQDVAAVDHGLADGLLAGAEGRESEGAFAAVRRAGRPVRIGRGGAGSAGGAACDCRRRRCRCGRLSPATARRRGTCPTLPTTSRT